MQCIHWLMGWVTIALNCVWSNQWMLKSAPLYCAVIKSFCQSCSCITCDTCSFYLLMLTVQNSQIPAKLLPKKNLSGPDNFSAIKWIQVLLTSFGCYRYTTSLLCYIYIHNQTETISISEREQKHPVYLFFGTSVYKAKCCLWIWL